MFSKTALFAALGVYGFIGYNLVKHDAPLSSWGITLGLLLLFNIGGGFLLGMIRGLSDAVAYYSAIYIQPTIPFISGILIYLFMDRL